MYWKFTHAAHASEVAQVGLSEHDAKSHGIAFDVYRTPLEQVNHAVLDGGEEGFVKLACVASDHPEPVP